MTVRTVNTSSYDVVVVGGGIVGAAAGFGLAARGQRVAVLDEGDTALRAARANFGLVWLQTKGDGMAAYMRWTRRSADLWPQFAAQLKEMTGVDTEYRKPGGLVFCLSATEFEARRERARRMSAQADVFDTEMIERKQLQALIPNMRLGDEVTGASYCPHDGDANPLLLLRALHAALRVTGAHYRPDAPARSAQYRAGRFVIDTPQGSIEAPKVVLAAGHGTPALAAPLGLHAPIRAERGQIIVTERIGPFLPYPANGIRQTENGTVMIGSSKEEVGFDVRTTVEVGVRMASRALRVAPDLARVRVQRTWAGIRVLTPDVHPLYAQSEQRPGAFVALCHSGVTLAAVHAMDFADAVLAGRLPESMNDFHPRRFNVPKAA